MYLKVLDGRARFEGRSSFKTWLHALIRNTAADERRRRSRQEAGLVAYRQLAPGAMSDARPDETLDRSQVQTLLRRALAELPERQQEVVQLVFYHDLSLSEAAEVMGVSVGSARTHYERGKERLRQLLEVGVALEICGLGFAVVDADGFSFGHLLQRRYAGGEEGLRIGEQTKPQIERSPLNETHDLHARCPLGLRRRFPPGASAAP